MITRRDNAMTDVIAPHYRQSKEGGLHSPYSKKPPAKKMTFSERREHEAKVAEMTEEYLAKGGTVTVCPSPAEYVFSNRAGIPRSGNLNS